MQGHVRAEQIAHHHEPHLAPSVGFHAVESVKLGEHGVVVLLHVLVVPRKHLPQHLHLLLVHGLAHEAVVVGQEEHGARLARGAHLPQRLVPAERAHVVPGVNPELFAQLLKHKRAVVLELEVPAGVRRRLRGGLATLAGEANLPGHVREVVLSKLARQLARGALHAPPHTQLQIEHEVVASVAFEYRLPQLVLLVARHLDELHLLLLGFSDGGVRRLVHL
mmetsp:Transcript_8832/g.16648  ORF Transcript_8832/g.16648 Transcript_8832/m.16648 type:complete len:221 (+) Transcript_8832:1377-2039(+)